MSSEDYNFHGEGLAEEAHDTYVEKGVINTADRVLNVKGQIGTLRRFHDAALALPEPGAYPDGFEGYLQRHFPDEVDQTALRRFLNASIIESVGAVILNSTKCQQYRIDRDAYEWVQRHLEPGPWPRCPHSGINNLGDGEFACTNDACDEVYERSDHAEVDG